ncbi:MAG: histidinol phosphate phosphatase domain-containing protein [Firmicutes bacterium]|nr:histidinol phosphate phosphatase domain-containing protein [Bacillota bacterium]
MVYDFHTHSFLSDGELSPVELIRRAVVNGYRAIAVTDHVGPGNMERVLKELIKECRLAEEYWPIIAAPGVELTHVPAGSIPDLAREARDLGAELVVVHGETLVEPVESGTNRAAVSCPLVDILAHPGLLTEEEARLALTNEVFIEISARGGHNVSNGHVAKVAGKAGVKLLVNSDTHQPGNLLTAAWAKIVAQGAGLNDDEVEKATVNNPLLIIERIKQRRNKF